MAIDFFLAPKAYLLSTNAQNFYRWTLDFESKYDINRQPHVQLPMRHSDGFVKILRYDSKRETLYWLGDLQQKFLYRAEEGQREVNRKFFLS